LQPELPGSRRILILSPFPPRRDGHHGGARSIAHSVAELAAGHRVRVLCLAADGEQPAEPALAGLCEKVEAVRRPGASVGFRRVLLTGASVAAGLPFWVGNWKVEEFRRRVRETVREWRPDIVHFEFHVMAQYADAAENSLGSNPTAQSKSQLADFEKKASQLIDGQVGWKVMEPAITDFYSTTFTEPELDVIIAFFKTPESAAFMEKMPKINDQVEQLATSRLTILKPQISQAFDDFRKTQAPTPAVTSPATKPAVKPATPATKPATPAANRAPAAAPTPASSKPK